MAAGTPGILTMCARQRFSATHVTSMTKGRPAMVLSKRCRTMVYECLKCAWGSRDILRTARGETSEGKYEGYVRSHGSDDSRRNRNKKNFACRVLNRIFTTRQQVFNTPSRLRRFGVQAHRAAGTGLT